MRYEKSAMATEAATNNSDESDQLSYKPQDVIYTIPHEYSGKGNQIAPTPSIDPNAIEQQQQAAAINAAKRKGTSNLETIMHIIKANIGTGVLAMPFAFKNGGLVLSSVALWIMAIIAVHCMHILVNCYKHVTDINKAAGVPISDNIGYDDVVELTIKESIERRRRRRRQQQQEQEQEQDVANESKWPKAARLLVSIFLIIAQLGICCVYLIFVPTNVKQVLDFYVPDNGMSVKLIMCMVIGPLALFCMIKSLKALAAFSAIANALMIGSMLVIMYELLFVGSMKPLAELDLVTSWRTWPVYFSSAIYAFEGISLVLPVHHEMRHKEQFAEWNGVLNTGMCMVAVMYFSIGFFGYLKYGHDSMASITLNLPIENVVFQVVKLLFAVAIFISYNLQFYVAAELLWTSACKSSKYLQSLRFNEHLARLRLIEYAFRLALVLVTFGLAMSVSRIDLFISLIGAVAGSNLAITIPPILDLIIFWPLSNHSIVKLAKNVLIILFGVYVFLAGTYVSINDIIDYFKHQ